MMAEPIDRSVLPIRRQAFSGVANRTLEGSQPDWEILSGPRAPEDAPNVLVVLIDDAGFGNPSTFGGPVSTPHLTALADEGLRYNRFHVTLAMGVGSQHCMIDPSVARRSTRPNPKPKPR
jgi:hypothetical protein